MQNNIAIMTETAKASGVIVANTFVTGSRSAATQSAAAGSSMGVATTGAAIGDVFPFISIGTAQVLSGAAFADNVFLDVDASGRAVVHAAGVIVARALSAATAANQIIEVLLISPIV
jgi:hypothetical protein